MHIKTRAPLPRPIVLAAAALASLGLLRPLAASGQSVVINEIHYAEDDPTVHSEFIELHNPGPAGVALDGWYFSDGVPFVFPAGTMLAAGGYVVVGEDPATLQAKWGVSGAGVLGWNTGVTPPVFGRLKNRGNTIVLRTAAGVKVDEVDYQIGFPWPTVGEPPNFSIELINPALDNSVGGNWRRSDGGNDFAAPRVFIPLGSAGWHYRKATSEASDPVPAWRAVDFAEDATWLTSASGAPFGYPASTAIKTMLTDMRQTATEPGYAGIYLRHTFEMAGSAPGALKLRVYNDDGLVAWLNGHEIARFGPAAGTEVGFSGVAGRIHAATAVDVITLTAPNALLNIGTPASPARNVLCIHALNTAATDTDFSIDAELKFDGDTPAGSPTPRAPNSVLAANAPPAIRSVEHTPIGGTVNQEWPQSGQEVRVTAKITDPDDVATASLAWQVVEPGDYVKLDDPRYEAPSSWTSTSLRDDGQDSDVTAGDAIFSALIPAVVQSHRRLIRYRITATDALAASARAPRLDDPQPNFAYFVYDGVPSYTARARPALPDVTYSPTVMASVPACHLITRVEEHARSQNVPVPRADGTTYNPPNDAYGHSFYNWHGALASHGRVYDHIRFRARGGVWRFAMGKNMWKFDFNKGHDFEARDDYGRKYSQPWKKLNFSACIQQILYSYGRGEHGLYEGVGFRLFQLSGVPAEHTQAVHFRIVERPSETNGTASQFDDDFQGLYLGIEQPDGQFLDEHGLPDGNLYKMESGTGELNNTGTLGPKDKSDLNAFTGTAGYSGASGASLAWWRANCDLPNYYNYRIIADCIHHYDIAYGKNYFYYRNPATAKWAVLPWDLDITWDNGGFPGGTGIQGLGGGDTEPFFRRVFGTSQTGNGPIPELRMELRNRAREVLDLIFTPEQTGMLIDEKAAAFYQPGQPCLADADRAMWDYNPIMVSSYVNVSQAGHGRFYLTAANDPATAADERNSFPGMLVKMKNYIVTRRGVITSQLLTAAEEALVPGTPVLTRADGGIGPLATNSLTFASSDFVGKNGATFAAMKWRLAEVTDPAAPGFNPYDRTAPRAYEATASWESPAMLAFQASATFPPVGARPGGIYRARVKHQDSTGRWSHWSAPVQFTAAEPDVTDFLNSLVVSQFMYHPAPPTPGEAVVAPDADDYEWIEIMNVGPGTLDLTPVRLTKGVDFDFAGSAVTSLAPGGRVLVVKNGAAFNARYAAAFPGVPVAGVWETGASLSNGGEQIKLSYGAGTAIRDFVYDEDTPWPDGANGTGHGLVLINPASRPDHRMAPHWRLSAQRHGSPGQADAVSYAGWAGNYGQLAPGVDTDGDGFVNLAEYAFGTSPVSDASVPSLSTALTAIDGANFLSISFVRQLGADGVDVLPEVSSNLTAWEGEPLAVFLLSARPLADGTALLTYRSLAAVESLPAQFVRLRLTTPAP